LRAPLPVRLLGRFPVLRRLPGRAIGLGIRRERVRSPYSLELAKSASTEPPLR
jgi:hypothetical protein